MIAALGSLPTCADAPPKPATPAPDIAAYTPMARLRAWPAAVRFIEEHGLNEVCAGAEGFDDLGIVVQGGNYNALVRAGRRGPGHRP